MEHYATDLTLSFGFWYYFPLWLFFNFRISCLVLSYLQPRAGNIKINADDLRIPGFNLELEINTVVSRVGVYISSNIQYRRNFIMEGTDSNMVIIDTLGSFPTRIINIYRSFSPQGGLSQREKFRYQLSLIKKASCKNIVIIGDINLDYSKLNYIDYINREFFNDFEEILGGLELIQMVEFPTWSRIVNDQLKESVLDHIYVTDPTSISSIINE